MYKQGKEEECFKPPAPDQSVWLFSALLVLGEEVCMRIDCSSSISWKSVQRHTFRPGISSFTSASPSSQSINARSSVLQSPSLHIWDLKADQDLTSMEGEIWRYLVRSWSAFKSQMWRLQGYLTEKTLKSHLSFIEWTRMRMTTKMLP
ncbi:unnamed protein product [Boreogadus saida]